jgi:hypothetical protein
LKVATRSWMQLSECPSGDSVIAVDFDGTVRREATFHEFAAMLPGVELWHTLTPPDPPESALASEYLDWWLDLQAQDGREIRAIFGYCAGSVFASALADRLEARLCARPPVVLFNPGLPDAATLHRDVRGVVDAMPGLTDEERAESRRRVESARIESDGDFSILSRCYVALYQDACERTFDRLGIAAELAAELAVLFRSYTTYLAAARQVVRGPRWSAGVSLAARDHHHTGFTTREITFDLSRGEILRSPEVAAATQVLLAERS